MSGTLAKDWIPWLRGECPVPPDSFVQVITASGEIDCERASDFDWQGSKEFPNERIIGYRPVASAGSV